jgi:SAM-dependent methyltransferase
VRTRGLDEVEQRLGDVAAVLRGKGEGALALEVGCGHGHAVQELAEACPGARVIGMNLRRDPHQLGGQEYLYGDASVALPLADDSADLIYSIVAIYFFSDRARFLEEAFRVLRPGGELRLNLHSEVPEQYAGLPRPDVVRTAGGELSLRDHLLGLGTHQVSVEPARLCDVTILRKRPADPPLDLGLVRLDEERLDYGTLMGPAGEGFLRNVYQARSSA